MFRELIGRIVGLAAWLKRHPIFVIILAMMTITTTLVGAVESLESAGSFVVNTVRPYFAATPEEKVRNLICAEIRSKHKSEMLDPENCRLFEHAFVDILADGTPDDIVAVWSVPSQTANIRPFYRVEVLLNDGKEYLVALSDGDSGGWYHGAPGPRIKLRKSGELTYLLVAPQEEGTCSNLSLYAYVFDGFSYFGKLAYTDDGTEFTGPGCGGLYFERGGRDYFSLGGRIYRVVVDQNQLGSELVDFPDINNLGPNVVALVIKEDGQVELRGEAKLEQSSKENGMPYLVTGLEPGSRVYFTSEIYTGSARVSWTSVDDNGEVIEGERASDAFEFKNDFLFQINESGEYLLSFRYIDTSVRIRVSTVDK